MIGKAYKAGTGFKGLAAYLQHGRAGMEQDRVDWVDSRNLPTRDPQAAARIMAATARDTDSIQAPVYHLSISFDPHDPVNRATMRQVAERTLRDLGLHDHQALIIAHRDRAHPHVHVVVNRVHPETHRVWSNSWDYPRIERSLRAQEAELGLRVVPGRHAPVPEHVRDRGRAPAERLARGDAAFVDRVRRDAGAHLTGARSWAELERGLAAHGLSVRVEGRGLVVTDGVQKAKGSEIDRAASRANLERRLGSLGEYRARQAVASRTLDGGFRITDGLRDAKRSELAVAESAPRSAAEPPRAPEPRQSATPQAQQDARAAASPPAPADPPSRHAPIRVEPPARRPTAPVPSAPEPVRIVPPRPPRSRPVAPAPPPAPAPRPSTPDLPDWLRDLAQSGAAIEAAERRVDEAAKAVHDAEHALAMIRDRTRRAEAARDNAAARLREVYADPKVALEAIKAFRREYGDQMLLSAINANPEQFGALRWEREPRLFGIFHRKDTTRAKSKAPLLAVGLDHHYATSAHAPTAEERTAAHQRATDATRALDAAHRARRALPPGHSSRYRRDLADLFRSVAAEVPGGAERLARRITTSIPSATRFVAATLDAVHDEERRRERGRGRGLGIDF